MTKLSIVAAVGLAAVLPTLASASVSGWVQCQQGQLVQTYVQGFGWYHYHALDGTQYRFDMPDPFTSHYSNAGWSVASGNWQVSASTTTTFGAGYCA